MVKQVDRSRKVKVTGMTRRPYYDMEISHGRGENKVPIIHKFLEIGAEPTREIHWEVPDKWDGELYLDPEVINGSRIKPIVTIPENISEQFDRHNLRERILDLGATYCKVPIIHVIRERVSRDERHKLELTIEESLEIFAEETRPSEKDLKISFAAKLAREADSGETE